MSTWFMNDHLSLLRLINKRDKLCGLHFGTTLFPTVPGNSMMTVQFITDSIGRGPGFDITIKQIPCFNSEFEEQDMYGTPNGPLVIEARDPKSQDTRFFNDDLVLPTKVLPTKTSITTHSKSQTYSSHPA